MKRVNSEMTSLSSVMPSHNSSLLLRNVVVDGQQSIVNTLVLGVIDITPNLTEEQKAFAENPLNTKIREMYATFEKAKLAADDEPQNVALKSIATAEQIIFDAYWCSLENLFIYSAGIYEVVNQHLNAETGERELVLESAAANSDDNPHPSALAQGRIIKRVTKARVASLTEARTADNAAATQMYNSNSIDFNKQWAILEQNQGVKEAQRFIGTVSLLNTVAPIVISKDQAFLLQFIVSAFVLKGSGPYGQNFNIY